MVGVQPLNHKQKCKKCVPTTTHGSVEPQRPCQEVSSSGTQGARNPKSVAPGPGQTSQPCEGILGVGSRPKGIFRAVVQRETEEKPICGPILRIHLKMAGPFCAKLKEKLPLAETIPHVSLLPFENGKTSKRLCSNVIRCHVGDSHFFSHSHTPHECWRVLLEGTAADLSREKPNGVHLQLGYPEPQNGKCSLWASL